MGTVTLPVKVKLRGAFLLNVVGKQSERRGVFEIGCLVDFD